MIRAPICHLERKVHRNRGQVQHLWGQEVARMLNSILESKKWLMRRNGPNLRFRKCYKTKKLLIRNGGYISASRNLTNKLFNVSMTKLRKRFLNVREQSRRRTLLRLRQPTIFLRLQKVDHYLPIYIRHRLSSKMAKFEPLNNSWKTKLDMNKKGMKT